MTLIIETIDLDIFDDLESFIFLIGFIITSTYVIMFRFTKKDEVKEDKHYYSRHNMPSKQNKNE